MSAQVILQQQVDNFAVLRQLIESADPAKIKAAEEEGRKQIQLTQNEISKATEAKAYIDKHAALASKMQDRENALADNKTAHELAVKQFEIRVASENTRIETFAAQVDTQKKQIEDIAKNQLIEADRLRGLGIDMSRQHQEAMNSLQKQEALNTINAKSNADEKERLRVWENTIKEKAQKLREQMASF